MYVPLGVRRSTGDRLEDGDSIKCQIHEIDEAHAVFREDVE